eukprot:4639284-Amphidinium_carterae.1
MQVSTGPTATGRGVLPSFDSGTHLHSAQHWSKGVHFGLLSLQGLLYQCFPLSPRRLTALKSV